MKTIACEIHEVCTTFRFLNMVWTGDPAGSVPVKHELTCL